MNELSATEWSCQLNIAFPGLQDCGACISRRGKGRCRQRNGGDGHILARLLDIDLTSIFAAPVTHSVADVQAGLVRRYADERPWKSHSVLRGSPSYGCDLIRARGRRCGNHRVGLPTRNASLLTSSECGSEDHDQSHSATCQPTLHHSAPICSRDGFLRRLARLQARAEVGENVAHLPIEARGIVGVSPGVDHSSRRHTPIAIYYVHWSTTIS